MPGITYPDTVSAIPLPHRIAKRIGAFIDERMSGQVIINIRDGEIIGAKIEEHVKA